MNYWEQVYHVFQSVVFEFGHQNSHAMKNKYEQSNNECIQGWHVRSNT